jgi:pre-mRNA cleavage complex 2 protein Pcf11
LDSIVKNVGTPYTVYLGKGLYSTFMDAYTLVDSSVRRAMEGMLKTWKEPVPGSLDKRPVFPPEVVRPIENALIKAKTAALQHQRLPQAGYKNTPTPPQTNGQFGPPPGQYAQHQYQRQQQPGHMQPPFQSTPVQQGGYQYPQPPQQQPRTDAESIKRDLVGVIAQTQRDFASDPSSPKIQQKLKALLDLQQILNLQEVAPQALQAIAAQIAQLAVPATPQPTATPPVSSTPQWQPPAQAPPFPFQPPAPFAQPPSAPPSFPQQPPPMPTFNPQQLSSLAALFQNTQKPSTPQIREAVPSLEKASHAQLHNIQTQPIATATPQLGSDLIASLTRAGLMKPPPATPAVPTPAAPVPPPANLMAMLSSLHKRNPSQNTVPFMPTTASGKPSVPTTNAALKTFRPELLRALYSDQPNQCSTCGRRFLATPEGKANKARHLDWHFRINQRLAEFSSSRAAAHRHWFPDAREWMQLEDFDASTASAADGDASSGKPGGAAAGSAGKLKGPEDLWIRAPAGVTKLNCPICYEDMRSSHPEDLQDWVFMNAVYNNGRPVHASCLQEMTPNAPALQQAQQAQQAQKQAPVAVQAQAQAQFPLQAMQSSSLQAALASLTQGAAAMREGSRTPDSALGKRKAEGDVMGSAEKMRRGGW